MLLSLSWQSLPWWLLPSSNAFHSGAHQIAHSSCLISTFGRRTGRKSHTEDNISTQQFIWTRSLWSWHLSPKTYWLSMKITKEMWSAWRRRRGWRRRRNWSSLLSDQISMFPVMIFPLVQAKLKTLPLLRDIKGISIVLCPRDSPFRGSLFILFCSLSGATFNE